MEYKVIAVGTQTRLESAIRLAISDGWEPIGAPYFAVKDGADMWIQGMTRKPKE